MKILVTFFTLLLIQKSRRCHAKGKNPYKYLHRYGYLSSMSDQVISNAQSVSKALKRFQTYAQIPVTGRMDSATKAMLMGPRCGSKDYEPTINTLVRGVPVMMSLNDMRRKKRYVQQGSKWQKKILTYSLHGSTRPRAKLSSRDVERTLDKSFKMWQAVTTLTFRKLRNNADADIRIKFGVDSHGDPYPFDGKDGTIAHGFYPVSLPGLEGDIHFDDDETWTLNGERDTSDFHWTSLHEIGHAIGLEHSQKRDAIMWPWFPGYKPSFKLTKDDIDGIQSIYGMPPRPTPAPVKVRKPTTICNIRRFDSVMYHRNSGETYFFRDSSVWTMDRRRTTGKHQAISYKWPGLPGYLDAAYTRRDGYTIFFKGNTYWKYWYSRRIEYGPLSRYIKNSRQVRLKKIDAAMVWDGNGRTYFFRKNHYWRFNEVKGTVDAGYPRRIEAGWQGVKGPVDGAMSWLRSKTFFVQGDEIYRFYNSVLKLKVKSKKYKNKINYFIKNCRGKS